jgi:hypothetical protein
MKELIIIDAFITNNVNELKLSNFIQRIKELGFPILLVSNTIIKDSILKEVDYYIYDSNNRLFEDTFKFYEKFILFEICENIKFNTFHYHKQPHALSVMVNLFNALNFAKNLGYTHFHRIEYDAKLGDLTLKKIKETSQKVSEKNKKGYFTVNTPHNKSQRFQYFFSEIKYFFQIIPLIKNQNDYLDLLVKLYDDSKTFQPIEKVIYDLIYSNRDLLIEEVDEAVEFKDSIWNTESSHSHLTKKDKSCRTNLYKGPECNILLSKNNKDEIVERIISFYKEEEKINEIIHKLTHLGQWIWNTIDKDIDTIIVTEEGVIIDTINVKEEINNFEILS